MDVHSLWPAQAPRARFHELGSSSFHSYVGSHGACLSLVPRSTMPPRFIPVLTNGRPASFFRLSNIPRRVHMDLSFTPSPIYGGR